MPCVLVFLFKESLDFFIILVKQVLVFTRYWSYGIHCWRMDGVSVQFSSGSSERRSSIASNRLQISLMKAYLLLSCFSLETSSLFGTFLSCGCRACWMRRLSLLTTSLWSVQQSPPHIVFVTLTFCLLPSYYDIINEMPEFGARMHPWRLVASWQTEDCVSDQQFMCTCILHLEDKI